MRRSLTPLPSREVWPLADYDVQAADHVWSPVVQPYEIPFIEKLVFSRYVPVATPPGLMSPLMVRTFIPALLPTVVGNEPLIVKLPSGLTLWEPVNESCPPDRAACNSRRHRRPAPKPPLGEGRRLRGRGLVRWVLRELWGGPGDFVPVGLVGDLNVPIGCERYVLKDASGHVVGLATVGVHA